MINDIAEFNQHLKAMSKFLHPISLKMIKNGEIGFADFFSSRPVPTIRGYDLTLGGTLREIDGTMILYLDYLTSDLRIDTLENYPMEKVISIDKADSVWMRFKAWRKAYNPDFIFPEVIKDAEEHFSYISKILDEE